MKLILENNTFHEWNHLEYVTIGSNFKTIKDYAFCRCNELTNITFGNKK